MSGLAQLVTLVGISLGIPAVLLLRRRTLAKMAMGNIVRKKRFTVIVVVGLLISTAMISGSLVVADTLDYIIKKDTYDSAGHVGEVVTVKDDAGEPTFFNQSIADGLVADVEAGSLGYIDGAARAIREGITVIKMGTNNSAPIAMIFAFDPAHMLNPLMREDGTPVAGDDVSNGKAVLNEKIADKLEAAAGDTVLMITSTGFTIPLEVSHVAKDIGMARWQNSQIVFVDLAFDQTAVFGKPTMINCIDVSNTGGVEDGFIMSDEAVDKLRSILLQGYDCEFSSVKESGIEAAQRNADQVSQIFIVMSMFAIIAGVALIINIFVMLAEERKPEMGISRAIGMQRGDLTQSFMFEGVVYALLASAVGAFVGLIIAMVMIALFSTVFRGEGIQWTLHFDWVSLAIAACAGFLITLLTVIVASWRVSKLNIVRAIRDILEPMLTKSEKRYIGVGIAAIAIGALLTVESFSSKQAAPITAGPALAAFGASLVAVRYVKPRIPFTLSGAFLIYWEIDPTDVRDALLGEITCGIEMFIVSGLVHVAGGVLIVVFNSDLLLEGLSKTLGKRRSLLPVFRAAISYPMNKRFRTGLTLFIFSLTMFTVVVIVMIASFQRESVDAVAEKFSGGFEILGFSMRDMTRKNITEGLANLNETLGTGIITRVEAATTAPITLRLDGENESHISTPIGFDDTMLLDGGFSLQKRAEGYESDAEVWAAVARDLNLAIMDGSVVPQLYGAQFGSFTVGIGEEIEVVLQSGSTTNVTVVGIMDQMFLQGVFTSSSFVNSAAPAARMNIFYIATANDSPVTDDEAAKELEREFVEYGFVTFVIKDTVETFMSMVSSIMQLMEVFLGVGLVVGIAGLGIITIRNVAERRQEIGVMRAIGFQRGMILGTFLLETSFVALLGIIIGVLLGLVLSYRIYDWGGFSENAPFVIPWTEISMLTLVAFVITLASTLPPSRKASRLAPAEALRRID
ncbi:MAG: FtsX-like permease family protein [Thermoplasmata archaeon]